MGCAPWEPGDCARRHARDPQRIGPRRYTLGNDATPRVGRQTRRRRRSHRGRWISSTTRSPGSIIKFAIVRSMLRTFVTSTWSGRAASPSVRDRREASRTTQDRRHVAVPLQSPQGRTRLVPRTLETSAFPRCSRVRCRLGLKPVRGTSCAPLSPRPRLRGPQSAGARERRPSFRFPPGLSSSLPGPCVVAMTRWSAHPASRRADAAGSRVPETILRARLRLYGSASAVEGPSPVSVAEELQERVRIRSPSPLCLLAIDRVQG